MANACLSSPVPNATAKKPPSRIFGSFRLSRVTYLSYRFLTMIRVKGQPTAESIRLWEALCKKPRPHQALRSRPSAFANRLVVDRAFLQAGDEADLSGRRYRAWASSDRTSASSVEPLSSHPATRSVGVWEYCAALGYSLGPLHSRECVTPSDKYER